MNGKEKNQSNITRRIIQIGKGETKQIYENDLFLITIDNILLDSETHSYKVVGKLNNGILTDRFSEKTQGESIQFDRYIIQIYKIVSDYVEFRVSLTNNR
jgi:hypothetical protein